MVDMGRVDAGSFHLPPEEGDADPADWARQAEVCPEVVTVSISSLRPGESPRLEGESKAHIMRLAAMETSLPPVLVDRRNMRIIDGMHRLLAASLRGLETIDVRFFDGSPADAFLHAVEANVTHGLPLSQADRRAAAERIVASHPHLSDRAIAQSAGLAAKTVAAIRHRADGAAPRSAARLGKDGKVRPLSSVAGRKRAAELIARHPQASLREVARKAGVSPATVRDVRKRLERGEDPAPVRAARAGGQGTPAGPATTGPATTGPAAAVPAVAGPAVVAPASADARPAGPPGRQTPGFVLGRLLRDPSLRGNEQGRRLLRWLQHNAAGPQERSTMIAAVPPHCAALIVQLARHNAQAWLDFAKALEERVRVIDPWAGGQAGAPD